MADFASLLRQAEGALKAKRFDEAMSFAYQAQILRPGEPDAEVTVARIEAQTGRTQAAIERFEGVVKNSPQNFDAHFWLSVLYRNEGKLVQSLGHACSAVEIRPIEAHAHSNLALTQMSQGDYAAAKANFERATRLAPQVAQNHEMLGKILWLQGKEHLALEAYKRARRIAPNSLDATLVLAQIASSQNRNDDAAELARQVIAKVPGSSVARLVLAGALVESGLAGPAQKQIEFVLKEDPTNGTALAMIGMQKQSLGQISEAKEAFKRSIELEPEQGLSYCALVRSSTVKDLSIVRSMENLAHSDKVNLRGKSFLHFGLGKALEDLGDYQSAIDHFDQANEIAYRLKFGDERFDRGRLSSYIDWTIETFTKEFIGRSQPKGSIGGPSPIFIVGMIRSGTTLAEQILSCHPDVDAAGERPFWLTHASEAIRPGTADLDKQELANLVTSYLGGLRRLFPSTPRITDKMPGNYRILGVIASAFPKAKIVHIKRNPIDTCLSIYTTPNRVANEFANNRENIVFAYRQYQRLMDHWQTVIGPEQMLTVDYETLVTDLEPSVRKLVEFCDLSWDDQCLKPEANERSVVTPSVWQVRQPVYTDSVERWRKYEPWLGVFSELRNA